MTSGGGTRALHGLVGPAALGNEADIVTVAVCVHALSQLKLRYTSEVVGECG